MTPRALIAQLEAMGETIGDIQKRLLDNLKDYADAGEEYLGSIERHIERAGQANALIIAEAAWLLHEDEAAVSGKASISEAAGRLTVAEAMRQGYRRRMQ